MRHLMLRSCFDIRTAQCWLPQSRTTRWVPHANGSYKLGAESELPAQPVQGAHTQGALLVHSACSLFACRTVLGKDQPGAGGKEELKQSSCSVMSRKPRVSFVLSALQSLFACSSLNFAFVEIAEKLLMSVEKDLLISVLNRSCCITTCSESWISLLLQQRWLFYNVFYKVLWNPLIKRFLQVCKLFTYLESEREELSHTVAQSKLGVHQQQ